jgi:hypothetical protein
MKHRQNSEKLRLCSMDNIVTVLNPTKHTHNSDLNIVWDRQLSK